ncbi:unnamed protein product [Closterium sp. NIES-54]
MASLSVLTFDHEGRPIQSDTWLDDLQLYLLSDSRNSVSLFDHTFGASLAPPATADSATRSSWLTHDAAARLAVLEDLVTHLSTSDARYRSALPTAFLDRNPPPMYITLYFIVTRLPDSLRAVRDHFLALDPTDLTVDLLEKHLRAAETSKVSVGAARDTPRTPFFEGCSPSPLSPSYASAAADDILGIEDVGTASALSGKRRSSKGKGGKSGGGGSRGGGGGGSGGGGGGGGGGSGGSGGGSGGSMAALVGAVGVAVAAAVGVVAVRVELYRGEVLAVARGSSSSVGARPLHPSSFTCGEFHSQHRCFSSLDDAWHAEFGDEAESPRWSKLLRFGVDIFALNYDAILAALYALSVSAEGDYYLCVPPDPRIEAAALGASESSLPGTAPAEALHTIMLDLGVSRCFFHDSTTLTPLPAPVPVRLADPSGGPVLARSSTILPCPPDPSGSLSGLHLPSFSTNLICTCTRTDRHLATFTRRPGSSLYTLTVEPPQVAVSTQVSASRPVAALCSCRLLSHQTLLLHHRFGHPSLPRLRGMHSCLLVSGLPTSLPPLPPSPAPPCLPCVEGRQRAAPHSSSFPLTTAPLQTLHMDVWGPVRVNRQSHERYFLLVVDDYTRYTTVFPLRNKGEVPDVLIPWIREVRLQLRERFRKDLPDLRLHSNRGVRYAAHQLNLWPRVSLPETSPTLRWTGKVCDASVFRVWGSRAFVSDTSADKLSSRAIPCVFHGFPPDAHGWQFYHPTLRRVLPSQDVTFDESVPFYRLFPFHTAPLPPLPLFFAPGPLPVDPLPPQGPAPSGVSRVDSLPRTVPFEVAVDSGAARGAASEDAASGGAEPGSAEPGGDEHAGAEPGGAESEGVESGGVEPGGAEPGGTEPEGVEPGGPAGASPRLSPRRGPLSPQQLGEWFAQRICLRSGAAEAGGSANGGTGARGSGATSLGGTGGAGAAGPGGAHTRAVDPGAGGAGAGGGGAGGADVGGAGAGVTGSGGTVQRRPFFVLPALLSLLPPDSVLRQVLSLPSSTGLPTSLLSPLPCHLQPQLQPDSSLPAPSPYAERTDSFTECHEPESRPALHVCTVRTGRRVPRSRPPPVPGTHVMALRPSSVPLRVPLPPPPESSLPAVPDPESDPARAASPIVSRLLAIVVTDPSFESTDASALVAELVDFATVCRLDYATALVAESQSACPVFDGGECALDTDVLEDKQEDFECLAAAVPHLVAMLLALEGDPDAPDIPTLRSYAEAITGTYVDAVPPSGANIVDGMWIFRVKRPTGSPPVFKARYVARGFSHRQGVDFFHTFSPTLKMTTLRVLLHVAAQRDYELHSLDFRAAHSRIGSSRGAQAARRAWWLQKGLQRAARGLQRAARREENRRAP